jgi:curved DNA-binding protein CbpA
VLGVKPDVSDIELRRVYRDLVKRHHPDHNGGSAESAARFAQIQLAYGQIAQRRRVTAPDAGVSDRIRDIEREMAAAREAERQVAQEQARRAREQARQAAESAAGNRRTEAETQHLRPTPEELGYFTTDDSFTKIIDDAAEQLASRLRGSEDLTERLRSAEAKKQFARRLSELFGRDD